MEQLKTLKQYAKEAKQRLKSGFWQEYHANLQAEMEKAESVGISPSKVKDYYAERISVTIKSSDDESERFYQKVKNMLDEEGEVPNAIGRLTDKEVFNNLSYDERQRYTLNLSEKYLKAVERYNKEKSIQLDK